MTEIERQQRQAVVDEARSWLKTPYHHEGRIKGPNGGVDCAMLLYEVFRACGLVPEVQIPTYSAQFHLHRSVEEYLSQIAPFGYELATYAANSPLPPCQAQPGDVIMYKFGRCYSHAAIVLEWPTVVHAFAKAGMVTLDDATQPYFRKHDCKIYSAWSPA